MKKLLQVLFVLIIAVLLGVWLQQGHGKVVITYAGWRIDLALWVAFLGAVLLMGMLFYVTKALYLFVSIPRFIKAWAKRHQNKKLEKFNQILKTLQEQETSWQQAQKLWQKLPASLRYQEVYLNAFLKPFCEKAPSGIAEKYLRKQLEKNWQEPFILYYSTLLFSDPKKQLILAEKWVKKHSNSAGLFYTLGVFCEKLMLWGKASSYFEESLRLKPSAQTHAKLGELLAAHNRPQEASDHFHQGLKLGLELK